MKTQQFWRFLVGLMACMAAMMIFMYSRLGNVKRTVLDTRCLDCDLDTRFRKINIQPRDVLAHVIKFKPKPTPNFTIGVDTGQVFQNVKHHHHEHNEKHHGFNPGFEKPRPQIQTEKSVAIGCAITTRGHKGLSTANLETELPVFRSMLASFCRTASIGYDYHIYLAHDYNDPFFHYNGSHTMFEKKFEMFIGMNCPRIINVTLHLVECDHAGNPAWAQNDAMMEAYLDNMAYYYRINDDTVMETTGWTERMIEQLLRYNPPNVGVVGPWFRDGNIAILTHDFVHRTHIDIFGFYYPRVFSDWFADDWITGVYWPERCRKVPGTRVKHTMEVGSRYVVHFEKANRVQLEVQIGKMMVGRWLLGMDKNHRELWPKDSKNIISMALYGTDENYLYGALRYAQLTPLIFKGWRMRVYVADPADKNMKYPPVKELYLKRLDNMGVEIVKVDNHTARVLSPSLWRFLIVDDERVERFIVRSPTTRPTEREASAIEAWMKANTTMHCIRDHPKHSFTSLTPGLIGGIPSKLRTLFGGPWAPLMNDYTSSTKFLQDFVWPKVKEHCMCHDSVSCTQWPGTKPYPVLRMENEYVGQFVDADDVSNLSDESMWNKKFIRPECVFIKETGFREDAVKSVIMNRPVLWSQDYHVTPIMDIKSLLRPIGVKIQDKSLSFYCHQVGTCAKGLKIITRDNGMRLSPELINQFYDVYKNDREMQAVTAYVCALPVAMCEAFLKFNKSIIVISTIRYEQGRPEPPKWRQLNQELINIASHKKSLVAANNLYDAKYIEYFTGIETAVIPNYCAYLSDSYRPSRKQFLVTPIHSNELSDKFYILFDEAIVRLRMTNLTIVPLRELYPQYLFSDIAAHPGIVYIPYQVSMSSLTEQYRMNIPMFFPSLTLLSKWHVEFQAVRQRTWAGYMMKRSSSSLIEGVKNWPDPNNDVDLEAVEYWMKFADYYQWPHMIYYNSIEDLVHKMEKTDLWAVSRKMAEHNAKERARIKDLWSQVLLRITPE